MEVAIAPSGDFTIAIEEKRGGVSHLSNVESIGGREGGILDAKNR